LRLIPVVLVSGEKDLSKQAAALEAVGYLHKPFPIRQLLSLVGNYLPRVAGPTQVP
jgi:DNA-binding response OmpR family regulator